MRRDAVVVLACALIAPRPAVAEPLPTPVDALGEDAARAFGGYNVVYYGAAVVGTAVLVPIGADHAVRLGVEQHLHAHAWGDAAYYTGYTTPVVLPLTLWLVGVAADDRRFAGAGSAAIQAVALTELTVVLLKVGTGRPFPRSSGREGPPARSDRPENSRDFTPFAFEGRYAWPSGHTAGAFSLAAALTAYAGDSAIVPAVAYPIAAGISAGMIVGDHHWASDVFAGALIGQAMGWSIGKSFRERSGSQSGTQSRGGRRAAPGFQVLPLVGGGVTGALVSLEL